MGVLFKGEKMDYLIITSVMCDIVIIFFVVKYVKRAMKQCLVESAGFIFKENTKLIKKFNDSLVEHVKNSDDKLHNEAIEATKEFIIEFYTGQDIKHGEWPGSFICESDKLKMKKEIASLAIEAIMSFDNESLIDGIVERINKKQLVKRNYR